VRYLGQPDQKAGRARLELMPADVAWLARILKVVQHEDG
jgi:hypothetical protein